MEFKELFEKVKDLKSLFQKEEVVFNQENLKKACKSFYDKGYCHCIEENVKKMEQLNYDTGFNLTNKSPVDYMKLFNAFNFKS